MAQKDDPFAEELRKSFVEVTIEAGSVLFPEGDKTSNEYFVTDGSDDFAFKNLSN